MKTLKTISDNIETAKDLDFGTIFSEAIELFKKTWVQGLLLQLFTIAIMLPLFLLFYIPFIAAVIAEQEGGYANNANAMNDFFAGMSIIYMIGLIVCVLVLSSVAVALNAGFLRIIKKLDNNEQNTTADFFYFFKMNYLKKAFVLMLVSIIIAIPAAILCYIPLIYAIVPLSFFAVFFAFNPELNVGDIVKASFKLGNKKWLISFGLIVVSSILAQLVGMLLCGIGVLITAPFVYHPIYLIYKKVIGFDEKSEIDAIGTSEL